MSRTVKFAGNETPLVGNEVKVGDKAVDFTVLNTDLSEVKLSDYAGKKVVVTVFPSVDTGVCSLQTKTFNEAASKVGDDVQIITVSNDLPFALARFCAAEGIDNLITTSDHRTLDFAMKYGYLLEEYRLLERGTVIIDQEGIIQYVEYCDEVTDEPNFKAALDVLNSL